MTPKQQEKLFRKVQARFTHWSNTQCSGYVHGVADEARFKRPHHPQVRAFGPRRSYATGYVYGFIDARGPDAFKDPWLKGMKDRMSYAMEHKWWEK